MKVAILGSRDQLCVNPAVMQAPSSKEKLNMCQEQASGSYEAIFGRTPSKSTYKIDNRINPNITGMGLLLNSTGMCVLSVTQFCVAFLLHKCVICVTQDV